MCGRFNVSSTPGLQSLLESLGSDLRLPPPRYNIAPTEPIPLFREGELVEARWWLTPHWARQVDQKYAMFNARCEGLEKSPAFRKPFASQRGVVPMSAFIEWRGSAPHKQPWQISNESGALCIAALWDIWRGGDESLLSCTLVTTAASPGFEPWHRRMPVMLSAGERQRWLDNGQRIDSGDSLFAPVLKEPLLLTPVDRAVGNARNKSAALHEAAGEVVVLPAER